MMRARAAISRIWNAYTVELTKAARSRYTWLLPLLMIAAVCLMPLTLPLARDGAADYRFVAYATRAAVNILGLIMLVAYSASLISTELGSGTACTSLLRPLRRHEFVAAKLLLAFTYAALIALIAGGASWAVAALFGDLTGVDYGGEAVYSNSSMLRAYVLGLALAIFPLCASAAYGVMVSSMTTSTGAAVGSAVGIWVAIDAVKYPLRIAPFLFSSWVEAPWNVFAGRADGLDPEWMPDAALIVLVSVVWTALFSTVAAFSVWRRNLHA
jgi:ABC-type transport system involved in multi-copper enzyme maturation permease subunit